MKTVIRLIGSGRPIAPMGTPRRKSVKLPKSMVYSYLHPSLLEIFVSFRPINGGSLSSQCESLPDLFLQIAARNGFIRSSTLQIEGKGLVTL